MAASIVVSIPPTLKVCKGWGSENHLSSIEPREGGGCVTTTSMLLGPGERGRRLKLHKGGRIGPGGTFGLHGNLLALSQALKELVG